MARPQDIKEAARTAAVVRDWPKAACLSVVADFSGSATQENDSDGESRAMRPAAVNEPMQPFEEFLSPQRSLL